MTNRVILCDIDHTLINDWFMFPAFKNEVEKGVLSAFGLQKIQDLLTHYHKGKLSYVEMGYKVLECYAAALRGQSLQETFNADFEFAHEQLHNIRPFFQDLIKYTINHDINLVLVTSEPLQMATALALAINADGIGSEMEVDQNENFTGSITYLMAPEEKLAAIEAKGYQPSDVIAAFGDSKSDEGMLGIAKNAFAVCPSEELRKTAKEQHWYILDENASFTEYQHLFI